MGTPNRLTDKRRNMYEGMKGARVYTSDAEAMESTVLEHYRTYGDLIEVARQFGYPEVRITNFRDKQGHRMFGHILVETDEHSWFTMSGEPIATRVKPGTPGPSGVLREGWDATEETSWCCQLLLKKTEDEIWESIRTGEFILEVDRIEDWDGDL